jgi:hypothetical protein
MKYIIIGTTSINRPNLHNYNIDEWCNWIVKEREYKIIWFINIDIIKNLEFTYEETKNNYEKILNTKVNEIYFLKNPDDKGNFFEACKRIAISINEYIENIGNITDNDFDKENDVKIVWLEDDWKLGKTSINFKNLINNYSTKNSCINLTFIRKNYIWALAPCILSYNLFIKLHYSAWFTQKTNIDPEHCLGIYYLNNYTISKKDNEINNLTIINQKKNVSTYNCIFEQNSYYTYYDIEYEQEKIEEKYIEQNEINIKLGEKDLFIRISPSLASDYGRKYMENINLFKNKTSINDNFYQKK